MRLHMVRPRFLGRRASHPKSPGKWRRKVPWKCVWHRLKQAWSGLEGTGPDLPPASATSDIIRWSRVLLSHTLGAARSS